MSTANPRAVALEALVRVEQGGYANLALPAMLRRAAPLDRRARAQATDLVYGTLRRQRSLDHLLGLVLDRPLHRLEPRVRAALRLGTYQLLDGTAAHAAVGETVSSVGAGARTRGFLNAVLRAVAGLGPPWPWPAGDDTTSFAIRASMPDWIVARLEADLGRDDARVALAAANDPAVLTLRPNPLRTEPAALARELAVAGAQVESGSLAPGSLLVRGAGDPAGLPAVAEGRATPQDQASQAVAVLVAAAPGESVLEVGAAPGGKATALAEAMGDRGRVVALDVHARRSGLVAAAGARLGLRTVSAVVGDGRRIPAADGTFDRVLVDAPCSGLGVLRRRPEARWRITAAAVDELATLQRALVAAAAEVLRPGGRLVYSVCTLTRAETVDVDEWLAATRPDLVPRDPPGAPWTPIGRGARLLPQAAGTDGMHVLALERA